MPPPSWQINYRPSQRYVNLQPALEYILVDEGELLRRDTLSEDNLAGLLFRFEHCPSIEHNFTNWFTLYVSALVMRATMNCADPELAHQKGGFSSFCWVFVGNRPTLGDGVTIPAKTELSEKIAKELKKRGFKFVGAVTVYAWMQAVGMVNDHGKNCARRREIAGLRVEDWVAT